MKSFLIDITLRSPTLLGDVAGGDPNSASGLPYIPGSVIRGMLIGEYMRAHGRAAADASFYSLFFGEARFLNAYPYSESEGERLLPTPLSWRCDKDDPGGDVYDLAVAPDIRPDLQLKGLGERAAFCYLAQQDGQSTQEDADEDSDVVVKTMSPERHISAHNFRDKEMGGRLSEGSSVFRYDALAAGQRYRAIVTLSAPEHAPVLDKLHALYQGLLSEGGRAFIGKSRGAGYGEVQLSQPAGAEITDHDEYHPSQQAGPLTVTLLSDALVRGSNGAMATDIAHLVSARPLRAFTRTRIVGGFNRTWGLPMPQELALQAGSVFVFEAKDEAAKALGRVAAAGIGERCVEGFGRIAVNWHAQAKLRRVSYTTPPPVARPLQQGSPGYQLAQTMAQRMLRAKLDATLIEVLNRLEIVQPPAQSQLARMRTFVREGWRTENLGLVTEQLIKLKSSRRQFEEAHVRGISLFKWMRDLANQPARVWDELRFQEGSRQEMPRVGGVDAKLDDRMAADYAARLMDGLLHKTAKAKRQQKTGGRS